MGRRKAKEEMNCIRRVTVRINEKTFQRLKTLAPTCNRRSVGGVVKCLLMNQKIMVLYRNRSFDECVQQLIRIREELRAIGVNINQITRHFHLSDTNQQKMFHALEVGEEYAKVNLKVEELIDKVHEVGRMWLEQPRKGERKTLEEI